MDIVTLIQTVGFPIAAVIACGVFIFKQWQQQTKREAALMDANNAFSRSLSEVASTIEKSNDVNQSLAETNRLLVDKVDATLVSINANVARILDKENK